MTLAAGVAVILSVDEPSKAGEARRRVSALARRLGFGDAEIGNIALVVTEAATNLHKHATQGVLIAQGIWEGETGVLDILSLDRGPGIDDVGRAMTDGFSTAGSSGNGLGALARLSPEFDLYSMLEAGTAVLARFRRPLTTDREPARFTLGSVSVPLLGEEVCGDGWAVAEEPGRLLVMVVDGLGHGMPAAEASRAAIESFRAHKGQTPEQIVRGSHEALRSTRGAAQAVALIDTEAGEVRFAGVGNISGVVLTPGNSRSSNMISHNGTVGHTVRKVQEFSYPWSPGSLLVMHSDGVASHWHLDRYAGLTARHPTLIAGLIYRDHVRGRDDATVLVARQRERRFQECSVVILLPILNLEINLEHDVVLARQRARQIAALLGFPLLDQTRIATATSEIARNAYQYSSGGRVEFLAESSAPPSLVIRIRAREPGIENVEAILEGRYESTTGLGLGILGARRLMDRFEVDARPETSATITMAKVLPRRTTAFSPPELSRVSAALAQHPPQGFLDELQEQNQELIRALQDLRDRQSEITELHRRELDETNRGVLALYTELDENAQALKRISDLKSRFLSNMSHEFRSPLNTISSLTAFLLERSDGDLTPEQEKQVTYIRKAAEGLTLLVNDLLDLAKVEAGKAVLRIRSLPVAELFENLRGTIRPLLAQRQVALVFDEPKDRLTIRTDEGKLTQILRNLLSNAVKYTERGEIRVSVAVKSAETISFLVADTGIGIAPEHHAQVFEEFGQVESPLQGRVKGTGLGLPLSKKLAELLGGTILLQSSPGVGSTFSLVIPRHLDDPDHEKGALDPHRHVDPSRLPLLVVEDDPVELLLYEKHLEGTGFQVLGAPGARRLAAISRRDQAGGRRARYPVRSPRAAGSFWPSSAPRSRRARFPSSSSLRSIWLTVPGRLARPTLASGRSVGNGCSRGSPRWRRASSGRRSS